MQLVYDPGPNRGPEPIHVGPPFSLTVTPGVPFDADPKFADALMAQVAGFYELKVREAPAPASAPKSKTKKGGSK